MMVVAADSLCCVRVRVSFFITFLIVMLIKSNKYSFKQWKKWVLFRANAHALFVSFELAVVCSEFNETKDPPLQQKHLK